nr:hypothetical protein Iba_chr13fCG6970 [Ipomoea batatas]
MSKSLGLTPSGSSQLKWYSKPAKEWAMLVEANEIPGHILLPAPNGLVAIAQALMMTLVLGDLDLEITQLPSRILQTPNTQSPQTSHTALLPASLRLPSTSQPPAGLTPAGRQQPPPHAQPHRVAAALLAAGRPPRFSPAVLPGVSGIRDRIMAMADVTDGEEVVVTLIGIAYN